MVTRIRSPKWRADGAVRRTPAPICWLPRCSPQPVAWLLVLCLVAGCSTSVTTPEPARHASGHAASQLEASAVTESGPLTILYPWDGALFPPEIAAPTFRWEGPGPGCDAWQIEVRLPDGSSLQARTASHQWTPTDEQWETIKSRSVDSEALVTIQGISSRAGDGLVGGASVAIRTSKDEVGAPLFYREVNLPFLDAVKDPSHIRWRFGEISSRQPPPVVLEKLPVCGNCHSFSGDGSLLGMDIDYANDKGSYALTAVAEEMVLDRQQIITWSDYEPQDNEPTFGLLSQVSPDGRYVVSTVKDRSVFVATEDLAFSQLFFPIKGILAVYDRQTKEFFALPGADDPRLVQSNAVWSPDGQYLVFARSEAYQLENLEDQSKALLTAKECREFLEGGKTFQYDLYRIPFNEGKGGSPEPLEGASHNGASNYFPKFSPDGKWIVYCRAKSFMLLQPDSELYIIPAAGGEARRLEANTSRMNSWHSWSPNSKWLVFSSKAFSPYTQLFLTHIDPQGNSSVPVVLSRFAAPDRAANIPEFVNVAPAAIRGIAADFLDDLNYLRAAVAFIRWGSDPVSAVPLFEKSLAINPGNEMSRLELASALTEQGRTDEAKAQIHRVLEVHPDDVVAHQRMAVVLASEGKLREAAEHCRHALRVRPESYESNLNLGRILLEDGQVEEAVGPLAEALRLSPKDPAANYYWGHIQQRRGDSREAAGYYRDAVTSDPEFVPALMALAALYIEDMKTEWSDPDEALAFANKACELTQHKDFNALRILAAVQAVGGQFDEAVRTARTALRIAVASGDRYSANRIQDMLRLYEQVQAGRQK